APPRDFVAEIGSGRYDDLKQRPVVTHCTGGVRCEVLSALLRARGFEEVYQLDGGVVRYGEVFGSQGLWEGSLYVFDERMHVELGPGSTPLGACTRGGCATAQYEDCAEPSRRTIVITVPGCLPAGLAA